MTDMNLSHIELVQTLVSDKISQAAEKIWSGVYWCHHQGIGGLDTMNKTMSNITVTSFHQLKL